MTGTAMTLKVNTIFTTLQGEGKYTGYPTTFVRLFGCNMRCTYCDSMYAVVGKQWKTMGVKKIVEEVKKMKNKHVCITGGEPLIQENVYPLIYELVQAGHVVNIETNGGVDLEEREFRSFAYTMDVKGLSSGAEHQNIYENLAKLTERDEVKFVIGNIEDYVFAKDVIRQYPTRANIIFSPLFRGKNSKIAEELAQWIMEDKIPKVRLGLQTHKFLNID